VQGTYIRGNRPSSKKALKEAIAQEPGDVTLEATSLFGNDYAGSLATAPSGEYYVVGPCPHTKRSWYRTINVSAAGTVTVK
jgi:hypothetical protein